MSAKRVKVAEGHFAQASVKDKAGGLQISFSFFAEKMMGN